MEWGVTRIPVAVAALYDDLLARAQEDALAGLGPRESFKQRMIKGRVYWYVVSPRPSKAHRYIGPDSPELRARIEAARTRAAEYADRAGLVRALRAAGLPAPEPRVGRLLAALADAGVFRLRAVLVGTHAFICYPAMLGVVLPRALGRTGDVDVAQDPAVSVHVEDRIDAPITDILRARVDPRFAPAPDLEGPGVTCAWRAPGLALELLASNRGARRTRLPLPALRAHGRAMPFMDYLIRDPVPAAVLHDGGVLVSVPEPARFAVHKVVVAARRGEPGSTKSRKDIAQAATLIRVLTEDRAADLRQAFAEARGNGPRWRKALADGLPLLPADVRARLSAGEA